MVVLSIMTVAGVLVSYFADRHRTWLGIKRGMGMFLNLFPFLLIMLALVSLVLFFIPNEMLIRYMGDVSGVAGWGLAAFFGSVSLIPGFIAFPFAYLLWKKGCSVRNIFIYLGAYSTIKIPMLTFEIGFMGLKLSLLRTIISLPLFIIAGFLMEQYLKGKPFRIRES